MTNTNTTSVVIRWEGNGREGGVGDCERRPSDLA